MLSQILKFSPRIRRHGGQELVPQGCRDAVKSQDLATVVLDSEGALEELAGDEEADRVLNAVVGSAGLEVSLKAAWRRRCALRLPTRRAWWRQAS
ncbi:MAG: hypothetical protein MZU79_03490 [Anaerotruncus sp.]|nr:hypothetical protein [Anaerotruncus sp.]